MRGLIIALAVLLVLLAVLMLRVGGRVEYSEEGLKVRVRAGALRILVYPRKKKKKEKKKREKTTEEKKTEKVEKTEKAEKAEKPEKAEKAEKAEKPEKAEKAEKTEKVEKAEKAEKAEKPEKAEKAEKAEKPEKAEKAEKVEKVEKAEKAEKVEKTEKSEKEEKKKAPGKKRGAMLSAVLSQAPEILRLAGEALGRLCIDELTLEYTIPGRYDAASAAIQYGSVYATGGVLYPMLSDALEVKRWNVGAEIDYREEKARVYVCLELSYRLGQLVVMGIHALKIFLRIRKRM